MAARTNNTTVIANIKALEGHAVEAVKAIERAELDQPRFEQCHECGEHFVPSDFDFAPVGGGVLPAGERNSDGELWVQCPNGHRGMWTK